MASQQPSNGSTDCAMIHVEFTDLAILQQQQQRQQQDQRQAGAHDNADDAAPSVEARDPIYFGYYALLTHQQNMLIDSVRTSTYQSAILQNHHVFQDALVMDVGAGSGVLSYFSAYAGARHVYAIEASNMARRIRQLLARTDTHNTFLKDRVTVVQSKVEDIKEELPKVDVIISEPIGVLLFHERMLESFVYARDKYLKPGGTIFPSSGSIFLSPFTDAILYTETMTKVRFWESTNFYGIDFSPLFDEAKDEYFAMPVVGHFDPKSLMAAPAAPYAMDFTTITREELLDLVIPFEWTVSYTGLIHGIGGWFDLAFTPPPIGDELGSTVAMSTAPNAANTHWQQVRFLLTEPLAVNAGDAVRGWLRCRVNAMRSYMIVGELVVNGTPLSDPADAGVADALALHVEERPEWLAARVGSRRRGRWMLHEQTYAYSYQPNAATDAAFKPEFACMYPPSS
ncbi:hypothetical protein GGF32_004720 [Allomyces javanicus]|nr:hypothetical protein GGF32_004720 [Allomyces javanicus]